jgi:hypothetical protein
MSDINFRECKFLDNRSEIPALHIKGLLHRAEGYLKDFPIKVAISKDNYSRGNLCQFKEFYFLFKNKFPRNVNKNVCKSNVVF